MKILKQIVSVRAVEKTFNQASGDTIVLFYFAGHGELDGAYDLHLLAADSRADLLQSTTISVDFLRRVMSQSRSRKQLLIIDSCFSGAVGRGLMASPRADARPLAKLENLMGRGRFIMASATPTQNAYEPNEEGVLFGNNALAHVEQGVFTHHLLEGLETGAADLNDDGYISVDELFEYVRNHVSAATGGRQTPMSWGLDVRGTLRLAKNRRGIVPSPRPQTPLRMTQILDIGNRTTIQSDVEIAERSAELCHLLQSDLLPELKIAAVEALCALHGKAPSVVQDILAQIIDTTSDDRLRATSKSAQQLLSGDMVYIPAGLSVMGNERIPCQAFYIDRFPVTNGRFQLYGNMHPIQGSWQQADWSLEQKQEPVTEITFQDAATFASWRGLRLPTESEWLRAAYSDSERQFPWGNTFDPARCNTIESGHMSKTSIDQFPNGASLFGVQDMAGNVWEWLDTGNGRSKVVRGGSWKRSQAQASHQSRLTPNVLHASDELGFRCVRDPFPRLST